MAEQKSNQVASAMGQVLRAYTKRQNADNELRMQIEMEKMKANEDYAVDIMRKSAEGKMKVAKEKEMYSWKQQQEQKQQFDLEGKYKALAEKKTQGVLSPTEQAQFNITEKKLGLAPTSAQRQKREAEGEARGAGIADIDETQLEAPDTGMWWWKKKGVKAGAGVKELSENMQTVGDLADFLNNIGSYRQQYGDEEVGLLIDYVSENIIPSLSIDQQKYLVDKGYIEEE